MFAAMVYAGALVLAAHRRLGQNRRVLTNRPPLCMSGLDLNLPRVTTIHKPAPKSKSHPSISPTQPLLPNSHIFDVVHGSHVYPSLSHKIPKIFTNPATDCNNPERPLSFANIPIVCLDSACQVSPLSCSWEAKLVSNPKPDHERRTERVGSPLIIHSPHTGVRFPVQRGPLCPTSQHKFLLSLQIPLASHLSPNGSDHLSSLNASSLSSSPHPFHPSTLRLATANQEPSLPLTTATPSPTLSWKTIKDTQPHLFPYLSLALQFSGPTQNSRTEPSRSPL